MQLIDIKDEHYTTFAVFNALTLILLQTPEASLLLCEEALTLKD